MSMIVILTAIFATISTVLIFWDSWRRERQKERASAEMLRQRDRYERDIRAALLLGREVTIQQLWNNRDNWNPEHPAKSLELRELDLDLVRWHVDPKHLDLPSALMRAEAARIVDRVIEKDISHLCPGPVPE